MKMSATCTFILMETKSFLYETFCTSTRSVKEDNSNSEVEVLSLHTSQVAHQAGGYPSFCSTKQLGVFLLSPGWDASPSQGYPPSLNLPVPMYTPEWREAL